MKRALVIGIDDYKDSPLQGCVSDALAIANLLERNGDGSPNFDVKRLTSNHRKVCTSHIMEATENLFEGDADTALFYFAGHGLINPTTNSGYLVSQDCSKGAWGLPFGDLLNMANDAHPNIKSTVIIVDCCQSGGIGDVPTSGSTMVSMIGSGVTILTACNRDQNASETDGRGLFTNILLDSLSGSSADIFGRITPASVYAHIDQHLGPWDQRPIYKANVQSFVRLREVGPKVSFDTLRRLHIIFPEPSSVLKLDPSFEPDRGDETAKLKRIKVVDENVRLYRELQSCYRHGLIAPVDQPYLWHAAIRSTGCKLTALGAHYRALAEKQRI